MFNGENLEIFLLKVEIKLECYLLLFVNGGVII